MFLSILVDCSDLLKSGHTQSGLYSVNPDGRGKLLSTVTCALTVEARQSFREDKMAR